MDYNRNVSEQLSELGIISPVSQGAGSVLSAAINAKLHRRIFAIVQVGVFGASATVDAQLQASATSGGAYTLITGTAITQLLAAGGNGKVVIIELKAETLAALGVGPFVKLQITVGTAATLVSGVVFGADERYEPASDWNGAEVAQIVVA